MKRYYLVPVRTRQTAEGPVRELDLPAGVNYSAVMSDTLTFGLAIIAAPDHTAFVANAAIDSLPEITMDATLSTLSNQVRTRLLNRMQARGISTTGITGSTTFRVVLQRIGKHLDIDFSELGFDVSE